MLEYDDIDWENSYFSISKDWFDRISDGLDIRENCRCEIENTNDPTFDEENVKAQAAMMILLYSVFPEGMSREEIYERINIIPFKEMSDETFRDYVKAVVSSRKN